MLATAIEHHTRNFIVEVFSEGSASLLHQTPTGSKRLIDRQLRKQTGAHHRSFRPSVMGHTASKQILGTTRTSSELTRTKPHAQCDCCRTDGRLQLATGHRKHLRSLQTYLQGLSKVGEPDTSSVAERGPLLPCSNILSLSRRLDGQ